MSGHGLIGRRKKRPLVRSLSFRFLPVLFKMCADCKKNLKLVCNKIISCTGSEHHTEYNEKWNAEEALNQ